MMLSLPLIFLIDMTFFNERLHFFKIYNCIEDKVFYALFLQKKNMWEDPTCPFIKFSLPLIFFCMTSVFKGQTSLLQNNVVCFVQMFHSYWRHMAHIQPWPVSSKNVTHTQGFYFIVMVSLYYCMFFNQMVHPLWRKLCPYLHQHLL
jgi:hypothetical protein